MFLLRTYFKSLMLALLVASNSHLSAVTVFNELDLGEFSDDFSNPTRIDVSNGVTTLDFSIGGGPRMGMAPNGTGGATDGSDADFFLIDLDPGQEITSIFVRSSEGGAHFFGAERGTQFSAQPDEDSTGEFASNLNAAFVFFPGVELLNFFDTDIPFEDFELAEDVSFLFQDNDEPGFVNVVIEITVVPEPTVLSSLGLCAALLVMRRRRMRI